MSVCAAEFIGLEPKKIADALNQFKGVARRQELRGEVAGVKVVDDFGHHPTAIKQTIDALKRRYTTGKMCAIFEPRSNTTRRNIFQKDLPIALGAAELCILAPVADPHKVPEKDRLNVQQVLDDIARMGRKAYLEPDVDAIVKRAVSLVEAGDTIVVFTNGGFGGIHEKLLAALAEKEKA